MRRFGVAVVALALLADAGSAEPVGQPTSASVRAGHLIDDANAALNAQDAAKARALMAQAAETGDPEGLNAYGAYLVEGYGGPRDLPRGMALLERAAAGGSDTGRLNLAVHLMRSPDPDTQRRARDLLIVVARNPAFAAQTYYPLGFMDISGAGGPQDMKTGVDLLEKSLTTTPHNADAMYLVARAYQQGWGGRAQDAAKAADLFRQAAEHDDPRAQRYYGMALLEGAGVAKDPAAAFVWFKKAADGGSRDALIDVAAMLSTGEGGVTVNQAEARTLYLKAAEMGSAYGLQGLGYMLVAGEGGAIDLPRGWAYLELAAAAGNRQAADLETMPQFATKPEARAEVNRIKAAWTAAHPISHTDIE